MLTQEQEIIIDTVANSSHELIKVSAISGAGKTHTLVEATKRLKPKNGLYIAYNKAIA